MINELVKNVIKVKEQMEADARARIFAEHRYAECAADNERLTKEVKRLLEEIDSLRKEKVE